MQDCFRQHPEMYGSELEDDEDEVEEELRANASKSETDQSTERPSPAASQSASSAVVEATDPQIKNSLIDTPKAVKAGQSGTSGDERW